MLKTFLELYEDKIRQGALQEDASQKKTLQHLQRLFDDIATPKKRLSLSSIKKEKHPKGVYLWGGVGRGKSMLMDLFFEYLPEDIAKRRVHFHEFLIEIHDFMHRAREDKQSALLEFSKDVAAKTKILCFDEFHVTDVADAMILGRLFTDLFERGVIVVATSNWHPERLYEDGLQRELFLPFIALMQEKLEIVELDGLYDYRLQCLSDNGVYFTPLGNGATDKANELFNLLTDGVVPYYEILSVKGRDIKVEAVAKGVARFSFAQLCKSPLGAEDFLTIAHAYHTVFLENVPVLGDIERNEAKRFMVLVDALYDCGTKLVVTAASLPDELYNGHDYEFEFQRTVSRLFEMQGKNYLVRSTNL